MPIISGLHHSDPQVQGQDQGVTRWFKTADNKFTGTSGNDQIHGRGGNDKLHGSDGDDLITGGHGHDKLYGDNGNDKLFGGDGKDKLFGGAGNDSLDGGGGRDKLVGGSGDDLLMGGGAKDTYVYQDTPGSGDLSVGGHDTIVDSGFNWLVLPQTALDQLTIGGITLSQVGKHQNLALASSINGENSIALAGNTLEIDLNHDGIFTAENDFQVSMVGVQSMTYHGHHHIFSFT